MDNYEVTNPIEKLSNFGRSMQELKDFQFQDGMRVVWKRISGVWNGIKEGCRKSFREGFRKGFRNGFRSRFFLWVVVFFLSVTVSVLAHSERFGGAFLNTRAVQQAVDLKEITQPAVNPEEMIRFHVLANSDSDEDQALKRAVRDAILKEVSPRLAASHSLEESRQILTGLRPEMEGIAQEVIRSWGKDYPVKTDYGHFIFPTKSYGSLILPAGEYEAVRVLIGEAKGSNWWCVLFPPLCFVDIEHSTAVPVDGKPGIPYDEKNALSTKQVNEQSKALEGKSKESTKPSSNLETKSMEKPVVRFWALEFLRKIF